MIDPKITNIELDYEFNCEVCGERMSWGYDTADSFFDGSPEHLFSCQCGAVYTGVVSPITVHVTRLKE